MFRMGRHSGAVVRAVALQRGMKTIMIRKGDADKKWNGGVTFPYDLELKTGDLDCPFGS